MKEFDRSKVYYKIMPRDGKVRDFQYKEGLNVLEGEFKGYGNCLDGGLYFTDIEHIHEYISYGDVIREVTIPSDALVYKNPDGIKWKTDKMILGETQEIPEEIYIKAVKRNGLTLKYVKDQTKEICLEAVKRNGLALEYVKEQTEEICLEAVKENGRALEYVKKQTKEICLEAVKRNGLALEYVKDQTEEICLEAVKEEGWALRYVKDQTKEICLEAVKEDGYALKYVKKEFRYLFKNK